MSPENVKTRAEHRYSLNQNDMRIVRLQKEEQMTNGAKGIPEAASAIIPRLVCRNVAAEIDFCTKTFGAVDRLRRPGTDGDTAHAMLTFGHRLCS